MVHQIDGKDNRDRLESLLDRCHLPAPKRRRHRNDDVPHDQDVRYDNRSVILGMGLATMLGLGAFAAGEISNGAAPTSVAPTMIATAIPPVISDKSRIDGLSEQRSEITGIVDPNSMTASYYWTFVVRNSTNADQEAQYEMVLPENSTVSRATLWINGKPQEAAFAETWKVQEAYNWITQRHRDPLLVTQTSPGHILIKAAPVKPHDKMQFRIGITAAGRLDGSNAEFNLPHIVSSNMGSEECRTDVHIQSSVPLSSSNSLLQTLVGGNNYLTRGSTFDMDDLTLKGVRSSSSRTFAARATHSFPPEYIVGKVRKDVAAPGALTLLKEPTIGRDCQFISDEDVAYRLSTLWAYREIERLAREQKMEQAGQLANAYRVVSTVSGATVLELESDYQYQGLNRDQYKTLSYSGSAGDAFNTGSQTQAPMLQGAINATIGPQAPMLQGATNGTIGPQGTDATIISGVNTAGTVRVNNLANAEAALSIVSHFSGPTGAAAANWMVASARDANLFSSDDCLFSGGVTTDPTNELMSGPVGFLGAIVLLVVFLGGIWLDFVGPVTTLKAAIMQTRTHDPQAGKSVAVGFVWLTAAFVLPIASQLAYLWVTGKRLLEKRRAKPIPASG